MMHTVPVEAISVAGDDILFFLNDCLLVASHCANTIAGTLIFTLPVSYHPYFINKEIEE